MPSIHEFIFETSPEDDVDTRLDKYLTALLDGHSRTMVQKLIDEEAVLVNGLKARRSLILEDGDRITANLPDAEAFDASAIEPLEMPLEIIHEDDDLVIINKSPDIIVHPAPSVKEPTLLSGLRHHWGRLPEAGSPERPGIVHRLDKNTSGLMAIAKNQKTYLAMVDMFRDRKVSKKYLSIVLGSYAAEEGSIRTYYGRNPSDRRKMTSKTRTGREAITNWRLLHSIKGCSLLDVEILTGRTHQIRVHMAETGHPVIGDHLYGNRERNILHLNPLLQTIANRLPGQALHSWKLAFNHPTTGERLEFTKLPNGPMMEMIEAMEYDIGNM